MTTSPRAVGTTPVRWPELPWREWEPTRSTLHMWLQIVGKVRLALAPPLNHWWHVPLYVTSRGLTTSPVPYGDRVFQVDFDLVEHRLHVTDGDPGSSATARHQSRSRADTSIWWTTTSGPSIAKHRQLTVSGSRAVPLAVVCGELGQLGLAVR
jgi:hypothetical protein